MAKAEGTPSFSERKRWIFRQCGHRTQPEPNLDDWRRINTQLNDWFQLDLDADTLETLTLMDHALADVKRYFNFAHITQDHADSTAAHSKHTMNLVQEMFDRAYPDGFPPEHADQLEAMRKDAIIGAWIHDMGELVVEGTTMGDMNKLPAAEQAKAKQYKDEVEAKVTEFGLRMAAKCAAGIHGAKPEDFRDIIQQIRVDTGVTHDDDRFTGKMFGAFPEIARWIDGHEQGLLEGMSEHHPIVDEVERIYDAVENNDSKGLVRPVVKCCERLEGVRYVQRNAGFDGQGVPLRYATSFQTLGTCRRAEMGLPELMDIAQPHEKHLAKAIIDRAYSTVVRGFIGHQDEKIVPYPPFIDTTVDAASEVAGDVSTIRDRMQAMRVASVHASRGASHDEIRSKLADLGLEAHTPAEPKKVINRIDAAKHYQAAREALFDEQADYKPSAPIIDQMSKGEIDTNIRDHLDAGAAKISRHVKGEANSQLVL
ncbi:MAG: hypothetical protein MRY32_10075 [Rickettsiales bacterium]|nr:hypothetical protein [Rickettsiales bacterium]